MKTKNIKVKGHTGSWYVIDEAYFRGGTAYLLESEQHGDDAPGLIINGNHQILAEDVYNGFDDLYEEA